MGAKQLATESVTTLKGNIAAAMTEKGKVATGRTLRSINVMAYGSDAEGSASLLADGQWKYVGNGRGPGKRPPLSPLREWIRARGLNLSEYVLANKIMKQGTRDFRLKRKNTFIEEIDAWEKKDVPEVKDKMAQEAKDKVSQIIEDSNIN